MLLVAVLGERDNAVGAASRTDSVRSADASPQSFGVRDDDFGRPRARDHGLGYPGPLAAGTQSAPLVDALDYSGTEGARRGLRAAPR